MAARPSNFRSACPMWRNNPRTLLTEVTSHNDITARPSQSKPKSEEGRLTTLSSFSEYAFTESVELPAG